MSETQHTPGPWEIRYGGLEGDTHFTICGTLVGHFGVIAEYAVPAPRDWREVPANARLIVASPDLLEELQKLVSLYEHMLREEDDAEDMPELRPAKAAIAKAITT